MCILYINDNNFDIPPPHKLSDYLKVNPRKRMKGLFKDSSILGKKGNALTIAL